MNIFTSLLSKEHIFLYMKSITSYITIYGINNFLACFTCVTELKNKILIHYHQILETGLYYNFYPKQVIQTLL